MKAAIALTILLSISPLVLGVPVDINIPETIKGNPGYIDAYGNVTAVPQRFVIDWENQGSVSCRTRLRVDIKNDSLYAYTAWSREVGLEPGDHSDFDTYFYPQYSGNYTAQYFVYHCNTIEDLGNRTFEAIVPENTADENGENAAGGENAETRATMPLGISSTNNESRISLKIAAKKSVPDFVVIPKKFPLGWIVESKKVSSMNEKEEMEVSIDYLPSIWKPLEIEFDIVSVDGKYHSTQKIQLKEETRGYTTEQLAIGGLSIAVLLLAALLVRERRRKK